MQEKQRKQAIVAAVALALVAVSVLGAWFYARGGGPVPEWFPFDSAAFDPLASGDAQETVLRSMRLAGIERAVVGEEGGTAVLRVEMPWVGSAADVEAVWQAGVVSLAVAYPGARRYVVQVFEGSTPLLEVSWDGGDARDAVGSDDPDALRSSAAFKYLSEEG